jgi:hypothetical protein
MCKQIYRRAMQLYLLDRYMWLYVLSDVTDALDNMNAINQHSVHMRLVGF